MLPWVAEFFEGTEIAEWFRQIIPVSMDIWIFFFLLPFLLAFVAQLLLSFGKNRTAVKLLPIFLALLLPALVYGCHALDILQPVFGGFLGLILIGTAAFIAAGSLFGWIVFAAVRLLRGKRRA